MAAIKTFNPENHPALAPEYSHVSVATFGPGTKLISVAGQIGSSDESPYTFPPTLSEQVKLALINVDTCLAAAGASKRDIISMRQYVKGFGKLGPEDQKGRAAAVMEWLGDMTPPPCTLVGVESLAIPDLLVEIEVTAVING